MNDVLMLHTEPLYQWFGAGKLFAIGRRQEFDARPLASFDGLSSVPVFGTLLFVLTSISPSRIFSNAGANFSFRGRPIEGVARPPVRSGFIEYRSHIDATLIRRHRIEHFQHGTIAGVAGWLPILVASFAIEFTTRPVTGKFREIDVVRHLGCADSGHNIPPLVVGNIRIDVAQCIPQHLCAHGLAGMFTRRTIDGVGCFHRVAKPG